MTEPWQVDLIGYVVPLQENHLKSKFITILDEAIRSTNTFIDLQRCHVMGLMNQREVLRFWKIDMITSHSSLQVQS
eukprot:12909876-Prorocentrum_lima.AAC.1